MLQQLSVTLCAAELSVSIRFCQQLPVFSRLILIKYACHGYSRWVFKQMKSHFVRDIVWFFSRFQYVVDVFRYILKCFLLKKVLDINVSTNKILWKPIFSPIFDYWSLVSCKNLIIIFYLNFLENLWNGKVFVAEIGSYSL